MDWTPVILKAIEILSPLFLALLSWVTWKLSQLINAKVKNENVRGALDRLNVAVTDAVKQTEQGTVAALKKAADDGKLTPEEIAAVRDETVKSVRSYLGSKGAAELEKVVDPAAIEAMIRTKIEATVHDLRILRSGGATLPPPPPSG